MGLESEGGGKRVGLRAIVKLFFLVPFFFTLNRLINIMKLFLSLFFFIYGPINQERERKLFQINLILVELNLLLLC